MASRAIELRALELGYRVVEHDRYERRLLLECYDCGARIERAAAIGSVQKPCTHPLVDAVTPYEEDRVCQTLVNGHGPMTLEEISLCTGVTRERVRQIEAQALLRAREACERIGLTAEEAREVLAFLANGGTQAAHDHWAAEAGESWGVLKGRWQGPRGNPAETRAGWKKYQATWRRKRRAVSHA